MAYRSESFFPLRYLFFLAKYCKTFIVNVKHELVLIWSVDDKNAVLWKKTVMTDTVDAVKVKLEKLRWNILYVTL